MTDLISKLADALVELNNASPRLPRKEQIEEVLRAAIDAPFIVSKDAIDAAIMPQFPMYVVSKTMFVEGENVPTYLAKQEQLVQAAELRWVDQFYTSVCGADKQQACNHRWSSFYRWATDELCFECPDCGAEKP